jgi:hypothetical protein
VTGLQAGNQRIEYQFPADAEVFLFFTTYRQDVGPTKPLIQRVIVVKVEGLAPIHSFPSSSKGKERQKTSTPQHITSGMMLNSIQKCFICIVFIIFFVALLKLPGKNSYIYMIYVLSAIGLSPGGSSTVHIYTQTIHRTQKKIHITTQK